MAHRNLRRVARPAPRYQWCGHNGVEDIETALATTVAEVTILCPSLGDSNDQSTVTVEKMFTRFSVTRIGTANVDASAFVIAIQETDPLTGFPQSVINPLDVVSDNFTLGLKQILMTGLLPFPGTMLKADDSRDITRGAMIIDYEFNGRRKINRMNHAITLTMVADASAELRVFNQTRILLRH